MSELSRALYANKTGRDTSGLGRRPLGQRATQENERRILPKYREPAEPRRRDYLAPVEAPIDAKPVEPRWKLWKPKELRRPTPPPPFALPRRPDRSPETRQ